MTGLFVFRFYESNNIASLVIFSTSKPSLNLVAKELKRDIENNLVPKRVYILTPKNFPQSHEECLNDQTFFNEYESYIGDINDSLICLTFDSVGKLNAVAGNTYDASLQQKILKQGMIALFKKHSGLIVSNHGYHFIKPSGHHCDKFIRASNLLVSSVEVSFLAISLLPHLHNNLKRIYVDTSSISFLVSTALMLSECFTTYPIIESFESYAALNGSYDFIEDSSSLVLISATTSGSFVKRLKKQTNFTDEQIITLFHLKLPQDQVGVFDISDTGASDLISEKASDCPFCKLGSKPIRIAGDQFLPENPKHDQLVIKKTDFNSNHQKFFKRFAATDVFGWNTIIKTANKEHFYIEVDKAIHLNDQDFEDNLLKKLKRYITRDLAIVIMLDDEGSKALSTRVKEHLSEQAGSIEWKTSTEIDENILKESGSVMVVAGAITSGRSLLSISRKLRAIKSTSTIVYLIGFSKLPSSESHEQLKKDLTQGGHEFVVLEKCSVPRIKEYSKTSWDAENEVLKQFALDDPLKDHPSIELPALLSSRQKDLASNSNPDKNQLFLPDHQNSPLKLRRTFAFWSDFAFDHSRLSKATQADVYWTIQSVLHDLRNKNENDGLSTTYHTTVINPANFDRFNDGIIQACILRSAQPVEMDYRIDYTFSRRMTDVISSVITNWNNEQGEAVLEFLMALWTKRLQVIDEHLKELCDLKDQSMSEEIKFIFDRVIESHEF